MNVSTLLGKVILIVSMFLAAGWINAAPVNVNTADVTTLAKNISGVGPKKAKAIIDYREANGPFKSNADLKKVKGIGQKLIDRNKDNILFSEVSMKTGKKLSAKN